MARASNSQLLKGLVVPLRDMMRRLSVRGLLVTPAWVQGGQPRRGQARHNQVHTPQQIIGVLLAKRFPQICVRVKGIIMPLAVALHQVGLQTCAAVAAFLASLPSIWIVSLS